MENKIRLGIIGVGNMGTTHTDNIMKGLCPDIVVTAVADLNPERKAWLTSMIEKYDYSDVAFFEDAIEMMDSGMVDACIVSIPHYDHPRYAIECMKRGLHVMVEKPAGVYTKQARQMNEEAEKHSEVVFGMMFNQRTNCVYRKMRELVQSGEYGQIRRTNWIITDWYRPQAYYDSGNWRATWSGEGGGVLLNQCPHNLDVLQWVCGMPSKITANLHFGKWHDIEVEDDVTAYLEYPNGATGTFVTSTADAPGTNRFEVTLDKGKIVAEQDDSGKHLTVWRTEDGRTEQEFSASNTAPFGAMKFVKTEYEVNVHSTGHVGVLNAFAGHILRGEPLLADGREGINGLTVSNAMHLSAFTGKTVHVADFDHDLYEAELMKRVATSKGKTNVTEASPVDMSKTYGA